MIKAAGEFYHEYTKDMVRSYIWSRNETQPFGGFIWIFVYVLAAQTSAGQAAPKFKIVSQMAGYVWTDHIFQ